MSMTPEGKVKDRVKKILQTYGAYYFMPVQTGFGSPGVDFHCCHKGRAFFVETKAPGNKPTPRQEITMMHMERAGGRTFVISGPQGYKELAKWLEMVTRNGQ